MLTDEQIEQYLNRIAWFGSREPTAEVLSEIQWAHVQTVPFEALDICPLGLEFGIDPAQVFEKVVVQRRGGFCFELNGVVAVLLESLGYAVTRMSAHFTDEPDEQHDLFDHLVLEVTVPGDGSRWYFDVAAGRQNPDRPVPIDAVGEDGRFRTRLAGELRHFEKADGEGGWVPQLVWTTVSRTLADFEERSRYFQIDPDSAFRKGPLCTVMIPDGRLTLSKWLLITTVSGVRTEQQLNSRLEVQAILAEWFGIDLGFDSWWDGDD